MGACKLSSKQRVETTACIVLLTPGINRAITDQVVDHAFSHGFYPQHVERLAAYWFEALGGRAYSDSYGDETAASRYTAETGSTKRWIGHAIACFDLALADVGLSNNDVLRQVLHDYFAWATTTTMSRYHQSADECTGRPQNPALVVGRTRGVTD